jgi:hypothetical protein
VHAARRRQEAEKHFIEGKRALMQRDFRRARRSIQEANTVINSRKLSLVTYGLLVTPRLMRWLYDKGARR